MDELVRKTLEEEYGFKVGRYLGHGGFARVYEAESAQGVRCAVKVSLDRLDGSGQGMQKQNQALQKELENLHLVQTITGHPHVVTLMDYWVIDGYLVTRWELATEGSLADLLGKHVQEGTQGIPLDTLLRYTYEAADAIDFLNGQGIYHRDIKPENLLLFHGHVKVADLGLAKFAGASTASHTGSGTLGYLPPEAYEDHRLTKTVDLYSLAATYVKLRTGSEPFGATPYQVLEGQKRGEPLVEGLGRHEAQWLRRALAFRPEDRPQEGAVAWVRGLYKALRSKARPQECDSRRGASSAGSDNDSGAAKVVLPPCQLKIGLLATVAASQLAITPDGRRAVSGSSDGTLRVWHLQTGACLHELRGHSKSVWCLAVTPDGRRAVSGSSDHTVRVWDLESGACLHELHGHIHLVKCLAITPDGRRAVSGSWDCTLRLWHLESGACLHELRWHTNLVTCLAITPDGRNAVSGSCDGTLRVWQLQTGACLHELRGHSKSVWCLGITRDGRRAVSGSEDCTLRVWDLQSGACLHALRARTDLVTCLAITPDGRKAVSGSWNCTLRLWHLESGTRLHALRGHTDLVTCLAITPDGRNAVSGSWDQTLRVWDLKTRACLDELRGHTQDVLCLAITPDGRYALSGGMDGIRVWALP